MIRASGLYGRAIVDLDTAERVGDVDEIIVDPSGPGVAGFVVACDRTLFGSRKRLIVPMEAVHAVGPDALTVRSVGRLDEQSAHLDGLPRLSELTGRRMVSFGGRLLGAMEDALIDEQMAGSSATRWRSRGRRVGLRQHSGRVEVGSTRLCAGRCRPPDWRAADRGAGRGDYNRRGP